MDIDYNNVIEMIIKAIPFMIDLSFFLLIIIILWKDYLRPNSIVKKNIKLLKKNLLITMILIYIIFFFILKIGFSLSDWSNLLGSFIGVLGAYMVANYQLSEEKKEKKILRKPMLYVRDNKLGDICFDFERHQLSLNGDLNGVMFREEVFESNLDDTLRNISLDLVNASSMNIYEVDYEWEIVVNQFKSNNLAQELVQTTSEKNRYNFKKKDPIDGNRVRSSNEVFYVTEIKNNNETIIIGDGTLALNGNISIDKSYIKPHESIEIYLPSAFLRLIENKIVTINKLRTPEDFNLPTLNLRINFLNYEMKKLSTLFKVSVKSTRQVTHRLESDVDVKVHNIEFFVIKEENLQLD